MSSKQPIVISDDEEASTLKKRQKTSHVKGEDGSEFFVEYSNERAPFGSQRDFSSESPYQVDVALQAFYVKLEEQVQSFDLQLESSTEPNLNQPVQQIAIASEHQALLNDRLSRFGLQQCGIPSDNNCLYKSFSRALWNTTSDSVIQFLRNSIINHLVKRREYHELFENEYTFRAYISHIQSQAWADPFQLVVLSELFNVKIILVSTTTTDIDPFLIYRNFREKPATIWLAYHPTFVYDAVIPKNKQTGGSGEGMEVDWSTQEDSGKIPQDRYEIPGFAQRNSSQLSESLSILQYIQSILEAQTRAHKVIQKRPQELTVTIHPKRADALLKKCVEYQERLLYQSSTIVFVGASGAGKSSLINHLLEVTMNEKDYEEFVLRDKTILSPQSVTPLLTGQEDFLDKIPFVSGLSLLSSSYEGYLLPVGDVESTTSVVYSIFKGQRVKLHIAFENPQTVHEYIEHLKATIIRVQSDDYSSEENNSKTHKSLSMIGKPPGYHLLDLSLSDVVIPDFYKDKLGTTITFSPITEKLSDALTIIRNEIGRYTLANGNFWGLVRSVSIELPTSLLENENIVIMDAPGTAHKDYIRTKYLRDCIDRASAVVMVLPSYEVDSDVQRVMKDSVFLKEILQGNEKKKLWVVIPADKTFKLEICKDINKRLKHEDDSKRKKFLTLRSLFTEAAPMSNARKRDKFAAEFISKSFSDPAPNVPTTVPELSQYSFGFLHIYWKILNKNESRVSILQSAINQIASEFSTTIIIRKLTEEVIDPFLLELDMVLELSGADNRDELCSIVQEKQKNWHKNWREISKKISTWKSQLEDEMKKCNEQWESYISDNYTDNKIKAKISQFAKDQERDVNKIIQQMSHPSSDGQFGGNALEDVIYRDLVTRAAGVFPAISTALGTDDLSMDSSATNLGRQILTTVVNSFKNIFELEKLTDEEETNYYIESILSLEKRKFISRVIGQMKIFFDFKALGLSEFFMRDIDHFLHAEIRKVLSGLRQTKPSTLLALLVESLGPVTANLRSKVLASINRIIQTKLTEFFKMGGRLYIDIRSYFMEMANTYKDTRFLDDAKFFKQCEQHQKELNEMKDFLLKLTENPSIEPSPDVLSNKKQVTGISKKNSWEAGETLSLLQFVASVTTNLNIKNKVPNISKHYLERAAHEIFAKNPMSNEGQPRKPTAIKNRIQMLRKHFASVEEVMDFYMKEVVTSNASPNETMATKFWKKTKQENNNKSNIFTLKDNFIIAKTIEEFFVNKRKEPHYSLSKYSSDLGEEALEDLFVKLKKKLSIEQIEIERQIHFLAQGWGTEPKHFRESLQYLKYVDLNAASPRSTSTTTTTTTTTTSSTSRSDSVIGTTDQSSDISNELSQDKSQQSVPTGSPAKNKEHTTNIYSCLCGKQFATSQSKASHCKSCAQYNKSIASNKNTKGKDKAVDLLDLLRVGLLAVGDKINYRGEIGTMTETGLEYNGKIYKKPSPWATHVAREKFNVSNKSNVGGWGVAFVGTKRLSDLKEKYMSMSTEGNSEKSIDNSVNK